MPLTAAKMRALTLVPVAIADFKAGRYEMNGVPCAVVDMFFEQLGQLGGVLFANIVANVGLHFEGVASTDGVYFHSTPALRALVAPSVTAVLQFRTQGPGTESYNFGMYTFDGNAIATIHTTRDGHPPAGMDPTYVGRTCEQTTPLVEQLSYDYFDVAATGAETPHWLVGSIIAGTLASSFNGSATASFTPPAAPGTDLIASSLFFQCAGDDNFGGGYGVTLERLTLYAHQPEDVLPGLSARFAA